MMKTIHNKRIVITGATSGIGKALTMQLLRDGARVAFCGRSGEKLDEMMREIGEAHIAPENYVAEAFDATNRAKIPAFVAKAAQHLESIDVLVNCTGANTAKAELVDIDINDLDYMINVNLITPFLFMKEVGRLMYKNQSGLIVNIQSTVCLYANETLGSYTASKTALDALTSVFRKEARKQNVRVSSVYPGGVNTPFRTNDRPDYLNVSDVVSAITYIINTDSTAAVDELLIRPMTERNFK